MKLKTILDKADLAFIHMVANPSKETAYQAVCMGRACAVRVIDAYAKVRENERQFRHMMKKTPKPELPENVEVTILNPYESYVKHLNLQIAKLGGMLFTALDMWQMYGATLEELKTICNGSGQYWYRAIVDSEKDEPFSKIVGAGYIDYKDTGEWIETTPNAPFTICMREFLLDQMLHTERGRKASHEVFNAVFPELAEKAVYRCVDGEGNTIFVDKNGEVVGYEPPKK